MQEAPPLPEPRVYGPDHPAPPKRTAAVEVHWRFPQSSANLADVLSAEERAQADRFRFDADRRAFQSAHDLLRHCLTRFRPKVRPEDWRFRIGLHGKPLPEDPADGLHFNLTHSRGLVACVVAKELECGVDCEGIHRFVEDGIPTRVAHESEWKALALLPQSEQAHRAASLWTLKEATLKTVGVGFSISAQETRFLWDEGGGILYQTGKAMADWPGPWLHRLLCPDDKHMLAVALRKPTS